MKKPILFLLLLLTVAGVKIDAQTASPMNDVAYPADLKKIALPGGVEMAYIDRGSGARTLVFIHGLGSNLKAWEKNVDSLSGQYRCIALDLPGYGRSSMGDYAYGMSFFAAQVNALLDALDLQNVVLVGHSMGGQVALTMVLKGAPRVEKVVLIAPAGIETFTEAEKLWFGAVYTPEVVKNTPPEQIRRNFELNFYRWPGDAEFMIADRMTLRASPAYDDWCRMIPQCVMGMLNEPVAARLSEITLPVLILYGENDALIPNRILHPTQNTLQIAQSAQAAIPGSQLRTFPECGHFVHWEKAAETNRAITEFLH